MRAETDGICKDHAVPDPDPVVVVVVVILVFVGPETLGPSWPKALFTPPPALILVGGTLVDGG